LEGDVPRALDLSQHALEVDPSYAPAHLTHAYNLLRAGRREEGEIELGYVSEHAPDSPGLARALACVARVPSQGRSDAEEAAACIDAP
jgi:hypothetical protein